MTIRLVCGPPGAGKNTYVEQHRKDSDTVVDLDQIRQSFRDDATAKTVRAALETAAHERDDDVWIIRTLADPKHRHDHAQKVGADEVVVIATPADVATSRAQGRDGNTDLAEPIQRWWDTYQPHDHDLTITPDTGTAIRQGENHMGDTQTHTGPQTNGTPATNDGGNTPEAGAGTGSEGKSTDKGFPDNTPLAEMTGEQATAYWKFHSRQHETVAKARADYDDQKALAEKWRAHEQQQLPEQERQLSVAKEAAKAEGATEERRKIAPQLVNAEFKIAAAGKVREETLTSFLEDMNHNLYIKDDGSIDVDRVTQRITTLSGDQPLSRSTGHQGHRPYEGTSSVNAGKEMFASRRKPNS